MTDITGSCTISRRDFRLTEFTNLAVTTIAGGENLRWCIALHPSALGSRQVTIAITHGRLADDPGVVHVLTLGEKTEEEGIQISVQPLQSPPQNNQLWTLEHILATKRSPPLFQAHIQSVQYPEFSAGTGILPVPLPRIFENVAAAVLGEEREKWTFNYVLP